MKTQELVQSADKLMLMAQATAQKPLMKRGDDATNIIQALCAMNVQLCRKIEAMEMYADE